MGVLENRRNVYFNDTINVNRGQESSDEDTGSDGGEDVPAVQTVNGDGQQNADNRRRNQQQTPPSPASGRKYQRCGHKLVLKKGRRSRQRCESERSLAVEVFGSADIPEEALEGWDIVNPTRSHFTALLTQSENAKLLKEFIEGATIEQGQDDYETRPRDQNGVPHHPEDPEEAFLSISTALRGALKKHYNEGALVALEQEIMAFFSENPCRDYVADHLDGYERLLAHAASKYHQLQSRSFDEDGKRKIKIGNPSRTEFQPIDPSLSKYLKIRAMRNKQRGL